MKTENKDLITIEHKTILEYYKKEKGLEPILDTIRNIVKEFVPDMKTATSRKDITSMAYRVSQSKVVLEGLANKLIDPQKKEVALVTTERIRVAKELDKLRDQIKKPLTDWQNDEKRRVADLVHKENRIKELGSLGQGINPKYLESYLVELDTLKPDDSWLEFYELNIERYESAKKHINDLIVIEKKTIADQFELEDLRKKQAIQNQKNHDEKVASDAAAKAKAVAEQKAKDDKEKLERDTKAEKEKLEKEKQDAIDNTKRLEQEKIDAEKKRLHDIEQAKIAEQKAIEAAKIEERKKIDLENKQKAEAEKLRLENKKHVDSILDKVESDLEKVIAQSSNDIDGDINAPFISEDIVKAIRENRIAHLKIEF